MIIFAAIVAIIIIGIVIFLIYNHNKREKDIKEQEESLQKGSWRKVLIIINISLILFINFALPFLTFTVWAYLSILINIAVIILVFNKNLQAKKMMNCIIIIYLLLMIGLPVYKVEYYQHLHNNEEPDHWWISTSEEYGLYNCYEIRIYRQTK